MIVLLFIELKAKLSKNFISFSHISYKISCSNNVSVDFKYRRHNQTVIFVYNDVIVNSFVSDQSSLLQRLQISSKLTGI